MNEEEKRPAFADRLFDAVAAKESPLVVGIDPDVTQIPGSLFDRPRQGESMREFLARGVQRFVEAIVAAVAPYACAVKPQLAYFERLGPAGLVAYEAAVACARAHGLLVIADGKRNDIASTAAQYAAAYLGPQRGRSGQERGSAGEWLAAADREGPKADALTVNGYLGRDSLDPFIQFLGSERGLFVLVKTSNPSSGDLQDRLVAPLGAVEGDGEAIRVAEVVAGWLEAFNRERAGRWGYGPLGAVVGATYPEELARIRKRFVHTPLLIPGFGAQGGGVDDALGGFDARGAGAVVNASRSILYACREHGDLPFDQAAARKAKEIKEAFQKALRST